ncbi:glyceraldehyde-3-phosphate dehydrogenase [Sulfurovum sp. XGS-02]|uniref:type I glyceraldehyde-3-phosphate dehydrogenase n=1 Tax=Sulfurovum sp. XGS-02 TaxID=2925411 RepID=UPI0020510025|nr:glyceraldehyde-3-phosphate dehydrogenase [Sulfurovum sp. XGS-02]UPT77780.1 glyceraldehyde-3-phosphate dehydrogenase [Sulfurovum sp. XGS-02]
MNAEKIRIFINGFGRIGRSAARIILEDSSFTLVGINDIYSFEQMAYLLKYDSIYGPLDHDMRVQEDCLVIGDQTVKLFCEPNPESMRIRALDVDVVLQCSGMFLTTESNVPWIQNGANRVIISTPVTDNTPTYIYGVNHKEYSKEPIISNSSCSANAIVPIFQILDKSFGIQSAMMSMYHSYTSYQNLLDAKHYSKDIRRTRSATQNIIPLMSSAAEATARFFPHLTEKLYAKSIRVPIASTTLYDLHIMLTGRYTKEEVNQLLEAEIRSAYGDVLDTTQNPNESDAYIMNPHSAVINLPFTTLVEGNLLRISAWQDNEYGYAKRLVDMAKVVHTRT